MLSFYHSCLQGLAQGSRCHIWWYTCLWVLEVWLSLRLISGFVGHITLPLVLLQFWSVSPFLFENLAYAPKSIRIYALRGVSLFRLVCLLSHFRTIELIIHEILSKIRIECIIIIFNRWFQTTIDGKLLIVWETGFFKHLNLGFSLLNNFRLKILLWLDKNWSIIILIHETFRFLMNGIDTCYLTDLRYVLKVKSLKGLIVVLKNWRLFSFTLHNLIVARACLCLSTDDTPGL